MAIIELTDEQRQAVQSGNGAPIEVVDPVTKQSYVLIGRDQFDQVSSVLEPLASAAPPEPPGGMTPIMFRSQQAFWRDLPELLKLKSKKRRFVAYHGDERIGFGKTDTELYKECFRRGLERGEFYVSDIEEDPDGIPPWGSAPIEESLFEFDDEPPTPPASPPR